MAIVKWWNKNTLGEDGEYCRHGDWHVLKPDDWDNPAFTKVSPPEESLRRRPYSVPCNWDEPTQAWELDWSAVADLREAEFFDLVNDQMVALFPRNDRERLSTALADSDTPAEAITMIKAVTDWADSCWDLYYELKPQYLAGQQVSYDPGDPPYTFQEIMAVIRPQT